MDIEEIENVPPVQDQDNQNSMFYPQSNQNSNNIFCKQQSNNIFSEQKQYNQNQNFLIFASQQQQVFSQSTTQINIFDNTNQTQIPLYNPFQQQEEQINEKSNYLDMFNQYAAKDEKEESDDGEYDVDEQQESEEEEEKNYGEINDEQDDDTNPQQLQKYYEEDDDQYMQAYLQARDQIPDEWD